MPEPTTPLDPLRSARRAELLQQLADLRSLRERVRPHRTRIDRERAALRRTLGRL